MSHVSATNLDDSGVDSSNRRRIEDWFFASVFDHLNDGVALFDTEGHLLRVNQAFERMFGWTQDELRGQVFPLTQTPFLPLAHDRLELICTDQIVEFEAIKRCKDGSLLNMVVTGAPVKDPYDRVSAVSYIYKNVTEQRRTLELLVQSEKLSAVGQLAAGVAHEVRNPLTALKGFVQLIRAMNDEVPRQYLEIMESELNRIEYIVGELLVLAKPHVTRRDEHKIPDIVQEVISLLQPQAALNDISITVRYIGDPPPVHCSLHHIKQVFVNLIKNALEAMPHGGTITVECGEEPEHIVVRISDEGVGIPEAALAHLGDPFYSTKPNGTGLGLMISRRLVQSHGGQLHIESVPGHGTTVTVTLPLTPYGEELDVPM